MKLTELKHWSKLTKEQKARLKAMYGSNAEITKTLHDTDKKSLKKAREQKKKNKKKKGKK